MRILGADLCLDSTGTAPRESAVVLVDEGGSVVAARHPRSVTDLATAVRELAGAEPFLLGVDVPVVMTDRPSRARAVENPVLRRLGFRLPPAGRAGGETTRPQATIEPLLAALAVAGAPCRP